MRLHRAVCLFVLSWLPASTALAGIDLGMKLACKKYGEAWNSGVQSALNTVTTTEFAKVWARMPADLYARLPHGGTGKVVSTTKHGTTGLVTVATNQGVMTFVVVGNGFNWLVADIHKPGDDGRQVSLKSYLDASLTAFEFMTGLKETGGSSFHRALTSNFRSAFSQLSASELDRIRAFIPPIRRDIHPYLVLDGDHATMRVHPPGAGANDFAIFQLARDQGWHVDDYAIDTATVKIASFKHSLSLIACVSAFGEFVAHPEQCDPASFTVNGTLRAMLAQARTEKPFPLVLGGARQEFVIAEHQEAVTIRYSDRTVRIRVAPAATGCAIDHIDVLAGDRWADLAHVVGLKRQLRDFSFAGFTFGGKLADLPAANLSLENASATSVETPTVAKAGPVTDHPGGTDQSERLPAIPAAAATTEAMPMESPLATDEGAAVHGPNTDANNRMPKRAVRGNRRQTRRSR